jgi:hypothetical protein
MAAAYGEGGGGRGAGGGWMGMAERRCGGAGGAGVDGNLRDGESGEVGGVAVGEWCVRNILNWLSLPLRQAGGCFAAL